MLKENVALLKQVFARDPVVKVLLLKVGTPHDCFTKPNTNKVEEERFNLTPGLRDSVHSQPAPRQNGMAEGPEQERYSPDSTQESERGGDKPFQTTPPVTLFGPDPISKQQVSYQAT